MVIASNGPMRGLNGTDRPKNGVSPAIAKNSCPASQIESAGSLMLKSPRLKLRRRPQSETRKPSSAMVTAAAAGPNQTREANTKVSETEIVARDDGTRMDSGPVINVSRMRMNQ